MLKQSCLKPLTVKLSLAFPRQKPAKLCFPQAHFRIISNTGTRFSQKLAHRFNFCCEVMKQLALIFMEYWSAFSLERTLQKTIEHEQVRVWACDSQRKTSEKLLLISPPATYKLNKNRTQLSSLRSILWRQVLTYWKKIFYFQTERQPESNDGSSHQRKQWTLRGLFAARLPHVLQAQPPRHILASGSSIHRCLKFSRLVLVATGSSASDSVLFPRSICRLSKRWRSL